MPTIPTEESIDAAWLTERLRAAGHTEVSVKGFTRAAIGTGQIGKCIRFELDLDDPAGDVPRTLVGKFPSDDPDSRATGVQLRNYLKEVSFYQTLQSRLTISTPRCYYAEIEGEGPEFALLLEDLSPAEQGDQLQGCSASIAHAAVQELVGLHAPSWCDDSLRGIDWIGEPNDESLTMIHTMYQSLLPGFLERYGAHLADDEADIIKRVGESPGVLMRLLSRPFSLIHVDYRLDNLLINAQMTPPKISTVDWQSITLGPPLNDVAYFLGAGLLPDIRREVEQEIVREYHTALQAQGIEDYPWDTCWEDYRRGTFAGFAVTVVASMLVGQTARGDEMFITMAQRHSRHALDLNADEFL